MSQTNNFENILIVRTDRVGDVILTTPAMRAIREGFPQAKLTLLVAASTYELIKGCPYVDTIICENRKRAHKGLLGFLKLVVELRKNKYDAAFIFHTKKRTNLLCFLAGIPRRIGYKNNKFGVLLTDPLVDNRHLGDKHEAEYCLDVVSSLGVVAKKKDLYVSIDKHALEWSQDCFRKNNLSENDLVITFHPGSSDPARRWPAYFFAELADLIVQKYKAKILVVGDPEIVPIGKKIAELAKNPIVDLTGKTTMAQFVSILKLSKLVISNDSGPVHVAAAAGTPVISIFTRNQPGINPTRWRPLGPKSHYVAVEPNTEISFAKAQYLDPKLLETIKPARVLEAVDDVFKLC